MSSNFSSTKAYCDSPKSRTSTAGSRADDVFEPSTSASKHSKTSKRPSKSSSKCSTRSSSKAASKKSSKHSSKSPSKHNSSATFSEISTNRVDNDDSTQPTSQAIRRYAASPTHSNPRYTSTTTTMTEAKFQARMQVVLNEIHPHLDLNDSQGGFDRAEIDHYDTQLDLDEDDFEES